MAGVKHHVVFVTGSRADYGIMRRFLSLLSDDPAIELGIIATGALLEAAFGHQVDLIYHDGFHVEREVPLPIDTKSNKAVLHTMAVCLDQFADVFAHHDIDLLMILGDRYEMLSVAIAAAMQRVPILHIHGGEATFGNYDEFIRHAITKMSWFHITATEAYRKRVIQLGEHPERVFCLGSLGAENCLHIDKKDVPEQVLSLPEKKYVVVLFHPETLTEASPLVQMQTLLQAFRQFADLQMVFLGANADTGSGQIRQCVKAFLDEKPNAVYFENLPTSAYHYLVKHSMCLVGNSSSGLIEAPSLKTWTVNIGHRQDGRIRGATVLDVDCKTEEIVRAIRSVSERSIPENQNPYYQTEAAKAYYQKTKQILSDIKEVTQHPKVFYDF